MPERFGPNAGSRIVIKDVELLEMADAFAKDYEAIMGQTLPVVTADSANEAATFFCALTKEGKGTVRVRLPYDGR